MIDPPEALSSRTLGRPQESAGARVKLAYLTEWFPPEPSTIALWVAEAMRGQGFHVGVVTGVPHYPVGEAQPGYRPTDWRIESVRGFRTLRVPELPSHDRSAIRRIATFGSFAGSGAVLASKQISGADVCLVYASPATAALPAMVARARSGTPYVLLIQDLWPDSIFATGFMTQGVVRRLAQNATGMFVQRSYAGASHICVISPGMRAALVERGVPEDKVSVVFNWVDEVVLHPTEPSGLLRPTLGLGRDAFVALFAGNAGEAQGLDAWVEAIASLTDTPDLHLALLGGGTQREALAALAGRLGVAGRVHLMPRVAAAELPALAADADVSVISLADRPLFRITVPSKVQASMAMGRPVVVSVAGDVADLVTEAGAGWVALPEDPRSIAEALRAAHLAGPEERAERGRAGLAYYRSHMAMAIGAPRLAAVLHRAAGAPAAAHTPPA